MNIISALIGIFIGAIATSIVYTILNKQKSNDTFIEPIAPSDSAKALSDELNRICQEIQKGNWRVTCDGSNFDDNGKAIATNLNYILKTMLGFIDGIPSPTVVVDNQARVIYVNKICRDQGFDLDQVFGLTPYELDPTDDQKRITSIAKEVAGTGKPQTCQLILTSPTGEELIEEYIFGPLTDANGNVLAVMWVNFDVSATVATTNKISAYQKYEATDIANKLREGLAVGKLAFNFTPEPHDEDTALSAAAYKQIGETLQSSIDSIHSYMEEITQILEAVANGNLTQTITREYLGDFAPIKNSVNSIVTRLNETVKEIGQVANNVGGGSSQLSSTSMHLADGTSNQMLAVQEMSDAVDIVDAQAKDNSTNAKKASELAALSRTNATTGNTEMQHLLQTMERISDSSDKISQIIKTIEGIAFQTNLLALNAAVEAARAGEMGRGFSVVAEEVRTLAARSAKAAKETTALIEESINNVKDGTQAANDTATSLNKIVQNVTDVSLVIDHIFESSDKQTSALGIIHHDLKQIGDVAQSSASTSEETAAAAEELDSQVTILNEKISFFNTK